MPPIKETIFFEFGEEDDKPLSEEPPPPWPPLPTLASYRNLFQNVKDEIAIGDVTPANFAARACRRAQRYLPEGKFICCLRQPVDRAYSAFLMHRRQRNEPEDAFEIAYRARATRWAQRWEKPLIPYRDAAWYLERLQDWYNRFDRSQIHICLYDELVADPVIFMQKIYGFLGVDDTFVPNVTTIHNQGFALRSTTAAKVLSRRGPGKMLLRRLIPAGLRTPLGKRLHAWNRRQSEPLDPELRRQLTAEQRDDILALQELIQRDLSFWFEPEPTPPVEDRADATG
jgi:hypothetical protein